MNDRSDMHTFGKSFAAAVKPYTVHADGGAEIPNIYVVAGKRIIDFAGMQSDSQILSLCEVELQNVPGDEKLILICTRTTENERG